MLSSHRQSPASQRTPIRKLNYSDNDEKMSRRMSQQSDTDLNQTDITFVVQRLRSVLSKRGTKTFTNLHRQLKIKDEDKDDLISLQEMIRGFQDYRIDINEKDLRLIFQYIDVQRKGRVQIYQLMDFIIGPLNSEKLSIVDHVFNVLDTDCDNLVQINDFKNAFNPRFHPDVRKGLRSESEVLAEFLDTYDSHHSNYISLRDTKISRKEFQAYFQILANIYLDDLDFSNYIMGTFKVIFNHSQKSQSSFLQKSQVTSNAPYGTMDNQTDYSRSPKPSMQTPNRKSSVQRNEPAGLASWSNLTAFNQISSKKQEQIQPAFAEQIEERIKLRGLFGLLQLIRSFLKQISENATISNSSQCILKRQQVYQAFLDVRFNIEGNQVYELMQSKENITFQGLLQSLLGRISDYRKNQIQSAFEKIAQKQQSSLELIKNRYNPQNHPDVQKGVKSQDEILVNFMETYEIHHSLYFENQKNPVNLMQFMSYYWLVSKITEDDVHFEKILRNGWTR